jgi:DNA polymerase III subunit beta
LHFSIPRKELLTPLKMAVSVVEQRQVIPILSNLLVSVENDSLSLIATDSEVEILCRVPLESRISTEDDGDVTIPAKKFLDICRSLSEQAIDVSTDGDRVVIRAGRSRFTLATLPAEDFPSSSENPDMLTIGVPQRQLRELIAQTAFCAAVNDVRYYLNGLLFDLMPDQLAVVATDGHRLALATTDFELGDSDPLQVIIPRKAIQELNRNLENSDDEVKITLDQTHVRFEISENLTITSKLIDGRFPEYQGVLPRNPDKIVVALCDPLKQALARVAILSNEKHKGVRLMVKPGTLSLSARNPEQEEAEEELEIDYDGEAFEIGFNVTYLTDTLNAIATEEVELCFSDPNSSCLVKPRHTEQQRYVIMPMRL